VIGPTRFWHLLFTRHLVLLFRSDFARQLIALGFIAAAVSQVAGLASGQSHGAAAKLATGRPEVFELGPVGPLTVSLAAAAPMQVELLIESGTPELTFVILAPSSQKVLSLTPDQSGWLTASFPVTESGTYSLVADVTAPPSERSGIRFRAELLPVSATSRARRLQAEALYAEAEKLPLGLPATRIGPALAECWRNPTTFTYAAH